MTMASLLRLYICFCLIQFITCACNHGAKPCEWEPWQRWSSCSRTCGVGYRTRKRNMCCGPILKDCVSKCSGDDVNIQSEVCNDRCPNGATLDGDICQCPPLKYGICCDEDEDHATSCARHCTWVNWYSWGDCSTSCGCGTRDRKRDVCCSLNSTQCVDDCSFEGDTTETRPCTNECPSKQGPNGCSLCSWNTWGSWSQSCSSPCGGGQRSRSRSPCCCTGQTTEDCITDCGLSETDATQKKPCNQLCFHGGSFTDKKCACKAGFAGKCCSTEVMASDCKKCSWQTWHPWEETGEDGKMRRTRELCCRIGHSAEDCMSECEVDENSQVQILLNSDKQLEVQMPANTTTDNTLESTLYLYLYAGGISLASVIVTSIVWGCCTYLTNKRNSKKSGSGSDNKPGNVYQMSVRGQEMDDWYEDMNAGANQADNSNYANVKF